MLAVNKDGWVEAYASGLTDSQIARRFSTNVNNVRYWRCQTGRAINRKNASTPPVKALRSEAVKRLIDSGMSVSDIALAFRLDGQTVRNAIARVAEVTLPDGTVFSKRASVDYACAVVEFCGGTWHVRAFARTPVKAVAPLYYWSLSGNQCAVAPVNMRTVTAHGGADAS